MRRRLDRHRCRWTGPTRSARLVGGVQHHAHPARRRPRRAGTARPGRRPRAAHAADQPAHQRQRAAPHRRAAAGGAHPARRRRPGRDPRAVATWSTSSSSWPWPAAATRPTSPWTWPRWSDGAAARVGRRTGRADPGRRRRHGASTAGASGLERARGQPAGERRQVRRRDGAPIEVRVRGGRGQRRRPRPRASTPPTPAASSTASTVPTRPAACPGPGLGLSIVRDVARAHGGDGVRPAPSGRRRRGRVHRRPGSTLTRFRTRTRRRFTRAPHAGGDLTNRPPGVRCPPTAPPCRRTTARRGRRRAPGARPGPGTRPASATSGSVVARWSSSSRGDAGSGDGPHPATARSSTLADPVSRRRREVASPAMVVRGDVLRVRRRRPDRGGRAAARRRASRPTSRC